MPVLPARNPKNLAIFFVLVIGAGFVYHVLTNVTKKDVIAFHNLDRQVDFDVMEPGDIVAISPDGQRHERICVATTKTDAPLSIHNGYYNSLGQVLPSFATIFMFVSGNRNIDPSEVQIHGEYRGLPIVGTRGELYADECGCEIARRMLLRNTVCQVQASLVEYSISADDERTAETMAVRYPTYANVVGEEVFKTCGLTYNATIETREQICASGNYSWDVKLRRMMNLIEERPLQPPAQRRPAVSASASVTAAATPGAPN